VLTQNTAWSNVEKAIVNLRKKKLLSPQKMKKVSSGTLRALIRPSGFYNEKTKKLKALVSYLMESCGGNLGKLGSSETAFLRKELLAIKGIGPETADSILLYAFGRSVFVIDAYTKRIFERHKLVREDDTYEEMQEFFMKNLPRKAKLFNEYHALIVELGKDYCKKSKPRCRICPLGVVKPLKVMV